MELRAGLIFRVAPFFHSRIDWTERLRVNGGVERDASRFYARDDWCAPTAAEMQRLLGKVADQEAAVTATQVALVVVPQHVRAAWWRVAERAERLDGRLDGFDGFVGELLEFLRFKRLPLPARCRCEVTANRPGQRSTRVDADGAPLGLEFSASAPGHMPARACAVINLGDEDTHLVVLNLLRTDLEALLSTGGAHRRAPLHDHNASTCGNGTLARFFTAMPDYPLVRVRLSPGDGLWLPSSNTAFDGWTVDKDDLDVVLTMWSDDGATAPPA